MTERQFLRRACRRGRGRARPLAPAAPARRVRRPGAGQGAARGRARRGDARGEALDHVLLAGPPGLGKTSLAHIVREELGVGIRTVAGPARRAEGRPGRDPHLARGARRPLHRRDPPAQPARSRRSSTRRSRTSGSTSSSARARRRGRSTLDLPPFTLVGATTRTGLLTTPLRDRFGMTFRLEYYEPAELAPIVRRSARILGVEIADEAADEIARRSRGTPRVANRILRRVRDVAEVRHAGAITAGDRPGGARAARGRRAGSRAHRPRAARGDRRTSSAAARSACRRSPSRSARSPTRSRTSTSRTCSSSASSSARRAAGSSPSSAARTSPPARRAPSADQPLLMPELWVPGLRRPRSTISSTASIAGSSSSPSEAGSSRRSSRSSSRDGVVRGRVDLAEPGYGFITLRPHPATTCRTR